MRSRFSIAASIFSTAAFTAVLSISVGLSINSGSASAQSSQNYSSSNMWGTAPSGVAIPGMAESAIAHAQDGAIAGQVNAAKKGILLNAGPGTSITSIGSQTIVSTTVYGDNNNTTVNATQSSSNSGSVNNSGTFHRQ